MKENDFQKNLIDELEERFPGIVIIKNDPSFRNGFPDLTLLYLNKWAVLECKRNESSTYRPLQEVYIDILNDMSFARTIYQENKESVLNELEQSFKNKRHTRFSKR